MVDSHWADYLLNSCGRNRQKEKYHNSDNADVAEARDTHKQICKVHSKTTVKKRKQTISERSMNMGGLSAVIFFFSLK